MIFNSIEFLLFFPIVILIYYLVPRKFRYIWLLLCSYYFYLSQSTSFVSLLLLTTISTYLTGIFLGNRKSLGVKKIVITICIILNLGILLAFKYLGLLTEMFMGRNLNLILPIGISFYTFQAVSYIVDCYRGKISPEKNIIRYALYVSFFPCILSGPINKAHDFMDELKCQNDLSLDDLKFGMMKMLWGYFLKLVIAARLTILVDTVYADAGSFGGASLMTAAVCYLFMLYCDFAGYSCIAIGAAQMLGIKMKENFRQPFFSLSMSELWGRWHVSLSSWLKEYLYFSLGGNRKGQARKYLNMMIVFIVSGIWHGSNPTFLIWGLLNGAFLIAGNILRERREAFAIRSGFAKWERTRACLMRIGVYCLYAFTMIFFAADSLKSAWSVIAGIFTRFSLISVFRGELFGLGLGVFNLLFSGLMAIAVMIADGYCYKNDWDITEMIRRMPNVVRWAFYLMLVILILFSANLTGTEFIYSKM